MAELNNRKGVVARVWRFKQRRTRSGEVVRLVLIYSPELDHELHKLYVAGKRRVYTRIDVPGWGDVFVRCSVVRSPLAGRYALYPLLPDGIQFLKIVELARGDKRTFEVVVKSVEP